MPASCGLLLGDGDVENQQTWMKAGEHAYPHTSTPLASEREGGKARKRERERAVCLHIHIGSVCMPHYTHSFPCHPDVCMCMRVHVCMSMLMCMEARS